MLNLLRDFGPVLLPVISSCYQKLATKAKEERFFPKAKSKKDKSSSGERSNTRQKKQTDEMDEFRSHLGMSSSSFILPGVSAMKGGMEVPLLQNWKTRLQKMVGTLLDNSASVQQKLGNSLFFHICVS